MSKSKHSKHVHGRTFSFQKQRHFSIILSVSQNAFEFRTLKKYFCAEKKKKKSDFAIRKQLSFPPKNASSGKPFKILLHKNIEK